MSRRPTVLRDPPATPTVDAHLGVISRPGDHRWAHGVTVERRRDVTFREIHLVEATVHDPQADTTETIYYTDDGFEITRAPESDRFNGIYWYVGAFADPALALVKGNPNLAARPPRERILVHAAGLGFAVDTVTDYRSHGYTERWQRTPSPRSK